MRKKIIMLFIVVAAISAAYAYYSIHRNNAADENKAKSQTQQSANADTEQSATDALEDDTPKFNDKIDMSKWVKHKKHHVYYQLGIPYCSTPADENIEKLAIFVPAKFMKCQRSRKTGLYKCEPRPDEFIGRYTVENAPIVIPVETPEYAAMPALTKYKDVQKFTKAGLIYVHAGCRGIEHAAPACVTDIKAAIRFLRHNKTSLPANTDNIYVFGVGEGGGQSAILGASGDSPLYQPYLQEIGALNFGSDAVRGVMAWSPLINVETANEAYEWNMGYTRKGLTQNQHELSNRMARAYVDYINNSGFRDEDNNPLLLQYSQRGIYQSGTYYDYVKRVIEDAVSEFLDKTDFPYTPPREEYKFGQFSSGEIKIKGEIDPQGTFLTRRQYLKYLNSRRKWIGYDFMQSKTVIRSVDDFIQSFKPATKEIGAFDAINRQQIENRLFRTDDGQNRHFDELTMKILHGHPKEKEFMDDFIATDRLGITVAQRRNMYSPLYYLLPSSQGFHSSKVAQFWRIRSGINRTETALTTEINLFLAAKRYPGVKDADFKAIWAEGQVIADEAGTTPEDAFLAWLDETINSDRWINMK